jgi:PAS domain S-box-containing protein
MKLSESIIDSSPFGFAYHRVVTDSENRPINIQFLKVNEAFEKLTGLKREKVIGNTATEVLPGIDSGDEEWIKTFAEVALTGTEKVFEQYSEPLEKWFQIQAWSDEKGYFAAFFVDITDQKRAQEKINEKEEEYREIFSNITQSIFVVDVTPGERFILRDFNDAQLKFAKMKREDIQGKEIEEVFPPDVAENILTHYRDCLKAGETISYEESVIMPANGKKNYLTTITPIRNDSGRIFRLVGTAVDITDRKMAEESLYKEKEFKNAILSSAADGIVVCDQDGKLVLFNEKAIEWHGIDLKNIPVEEGANHYDLYHLDGETPLKPEEIPLVRAFNGEMVLNAGMSIVPKGKEPRYILASGSPIKDQEGNKMGAVIIMKDISARLKAELKVKESEQRFRNLAFNVPGVIYLCENDDQYSMIFVNDQVEKMTGYSRHDFLKQKVNFADLMHTDDYRKVKSAIDEAIEKKRAFQVEYRLYDKTGAMHWVLENGVGIFDEEDNLLHLEGYISDVTEKKIAEDLAYKASQQLEFHIENSPLAVIVSDENFEVTQWSKSAEELFGWSEDEVLKKNRADWNFTHKDDLDVVNKKIDELIVEKKSSNVSHNRNITKDGRVLHCEWYNSVMFDKEGDIISIFSLVHDVSDRVEKEIALKESLSEKEIMLAEIHHRVKNNLAVVSGLMQLQALGADNPKLEADLYDSVNRIKTMASVHELLYQSENYARLDFKETITKLVNNVSETLQSETGVDIDMHCDDIKLNINKAIPTSLIVNEVVTNVYKHAFNGRNRGTLSVQVGKLNGEINLLIKDDGVGIEKDLGSETGPYERRGSLGMHLIHELVNQLGGTFRYANIAPGTEFHLTFKSEDR